jgi:hypothetical protein
MRCVHEQVRDRCSFRPKRTWLSRSSGSKERLSPTPSSNCKKIEKFRQQVGMKTWPDDAIFSDFPMGLAKVGWSQK